MAIAGRVAIVPKGKWLATLSYSKLDMVTYNSNAYVAYKDSVGIEPTNEEYWMLTIENVTAKDLAELQTNVKALFDGTTPAGDSKKLNGLAAEYYEQGHAYHLSEGTILDFANNPNGIYKKIVINPYFPSDCPREVEGFVQLLLNTGRITVIYSEYATAEHKVWMRNVFNGSWLDEEWYCISDGGNADTVDGYHVSDLVHDFGIITKSDSGCNTLLEWLRLKNAQGIRCLSASVAGFDDLPRTDWHYGLKARTYGNVQVEIWKYLNTDGSAILRRETDSTGEWSGDWTTSYLPLAGGTLSGSIGVGTGYAMLACDSNHAKVFSFCDASNHTDNFRAISVINQKSLNDVQTALQFQNVENGIITNYVVLHTGNSAPVAIQESAPSDTTALWYDIANKKIKAYIDGAWTATA